MSSRDGLYRNFVTKLWSAQKRSSHGHIITYAILITLSSNINSFLGVAIRRTRKTKYAYGLHYNIGVIYFLEGLAWDGDSGGLFPSRYPKISYVSSRNWCGCPGMSLSFDLRHVTDGDHE